MPPRQRGRHPAAPPPAKPPRTTYTPEQRATALEHYTEHGPAEAERRTGIPRRTISSWARRAGVQSEAPAKTKAAVEAAAVTLEQRKQELAGRLLTEAAGLLDRLHQPVTRQEVVKMPGQIVAGHEDDGSPIMASGWVEATITQPRPTEVQAKALLVSAAIAVDKVQVLTGGATHRVAFEGEGDAEVKSVAAEIIQLAERRRTG